MFYPRRLLLVLAAVALPYPSLVHAQTEAWTVYASVVDRAGAPVQGLGAPDFVVRENGMAREILRVAPASDPIRIALLIDTSQEMRDELIDVRQSLRTFVSEIDRRHIELNNQYQVVCARPKTLIPPKTIDVGVRQPEAVVRAPRVF